MENRVYLNDDWKFSEQFTEEMLGDGFDVGNMTPVRLPHTVKETPLHYFDESVYQMVRCLYYGRMERKTSAAHD